MRPLRPYRCSRSSRSWPAVIGLLLCLAACGCGSSSPEASSASAPPAAQEIPPATALPAAVRDAPKTSSSAARTDGAPVAEASAELPAELPAEAPSERQTDSSPAERVAESTGSTANPLLEAELAAGTGASAADAERQRERQRERDLRAAGVGIRKLSSRHLTLYTDLPPDREVDELPEVFDQAVPQWCEYFEIDPETVGDWHLTGYLMDDRERFQRSGLLPDDLPQFLHGYLRADELWIYEQPSSYYRRHLLLHEGTHGFMYRWFGGAGPVWYMEGVAELLATHRWHDRQLSLRYFPQDKDETPHWGRIKLVRDAAEAERALQLSHIMKFEPEAFLNVEAYAWSWAIAAFFDFHPDLQHTFRSFRKYARDRGPAFSQNFYEQFQDRWPEINEQWQLFVVNIEYGYELPRELVVRAAGRSLQSAETVEVGLQVDRGWQSSGIRLEAGRSYDVAAQGRYQLVAAPRPWASEPGGVTLRYHQGQPLGKLLAAVRPDQLDEDRLSPLAEPEPLGLRRQLVPEVSGTLYLRINDSPAELGDNQGQLRVWIRETPVAPD